MGVNNMKTIVEHHIKKLFTLREELKQPIDDTFYTEYNKELYYITQAKIIKLKLYLQRKGY